MQTYIIIQYGNPLISLKFDKVQQGLAYSSNQTNFIFEYHSWQVLSNYNSFIGVLSNGSIILQKLDTFAY